MSLRTLAIATTAAAALAGPAGATILTFNIDSLQPLSNLTMVQEYGDRVTGVTQGKFSYGLGFEGFTPNVVVDYGGSTPGTLLSRWSTDYGDLVNILANDDDGDTLLQVKFTADAGYQAKLFSFDFSGWNHADYTLKGVSVIGDGGAVLFDAEDVHVEGTNGHSTLDFGAGLVGQTLTLNIDLTGLGFQSDNIGIDNIRFGQSPPGVALDLPPTAVPEPSAWALTILGFMTIGAAARRRRISGSPRVQAARPGLGRV